MERTQKIEEALSVVWEEKEENSHDRDKIKNKILKKIGEDILDDLAKEGYVNLDNNSVKFTTKGEVAARDIMRRQRLAERLLVDVLALGRQEMTSSAWDPPHRL